MQRWWLQTVSVLCLGCLVLIGTATTIPITGDVIAFERSRLGNTDLYLLDVRSRLLYPLTRTPQRVERFPSWSPDGTHIVYQHEHAFRGSTRSPDTGTLHIMDISQPEDITELRVSERRVLHPTWSPDGTRIAFSTYNPAYGSNNIHIIDLPTGEIWNAVPSREITQFLPAWSPDGRLLTFSATRLLDNDMTPRIYVAAPLDPPSQRSKEPSGGLFGQLTELISSAQPTWTVDGQQIVFTSALTENNLYITDVETPTTPRPISDLMRAEFPSISPDGVWIALSGGTIGVRNLYRVSVDGTRREQLTDSFTSDNAPAWMPRSP